MKIQIEITDTYGGEANYAWVTRGEVETVKDTINARVRAAKRFAGWQGIKCYVERIPDEYDTLIIRPRSGLCQIMFVS
jgi:hypothetical protein